MKKKLIGEKDVILAVRVVVPEEEARRLKAELALEGRTLRAFVTEKIHEYVLLNGRRP